MPRKPKVAVIGAGIGGLTAAVALHQRDIDVEVYEQSPQIAEIGAGVSLSPNAVKAFRALGLDAPITAIGFESDNQLVRAWNSGDVISKVFRKGVYEKEFGAPYLSVHRADLVDVLRRQLPDRVFHLGAHCFGVETSDTGARARFADGAAVEADLIVGASKLVWQGRAPIHGVGLLARIGSDQCISTWSNQYRPHALYGTAQPCHSFHGSWRQVGQFRRPR
jgi:salicylate hydroxylase